MKLFKKVKHSNGVRDIYILGIKIFSYCHSGRKYETASLSIDDINLIHNKYQNKENELRVKRRNNEPINVAFLVGMTSMFCAKPIMKAMLQNQRFNVSIIVVPDLRFGVDNAKNNMKKTLKELEEYKDFIISSDIDEANDKINLSQIADICFMSVPYDFSHYKYTIQQIIEKDILPVMVNYGFFRSKFDRENLVASVVYSLYWKVFAETSYNLDEFLNYSLIKGENVVLTGYCKMDEYVHLNKKSKNKTIMIAPHHSVSGGFNDVLALSNFEKYADLFLNLPNLYPDINFIFRPHPALFSVLSRENFWGKDKVAQYVNKMKNYKNVFYSEGGNYFNEFAQSDAIIQDCGSYLVEYFYTKKPQCYLLKTPQDIEDKFVELGQKCLDCCYLAYDEKEILNFIDNIVVAENDELKHKREKFADEIMLNYPMASQKVIDYFENLFNEE